MAREQIPITPAVVRWARERAGYSLEEASPKFKSIAEWELEGSEEPIYPTYPQLELMAAAFKVPVAVFFFPEPPQLPPIEETFRTLPEAELSALEPRIKLLLRKAKALQLNLSELNGGRNPAKRLITRDLKFPINVQASAMAESVRQYLGVPLEEQTSWNTVEIALERWRAKFADVGVFVFKDQFRSPRFAGFCLTDEEFPIIYVNNTAAKSRQIFTLFHELGHLLFHTSGVDFRSQEIPPTSTVDDRRIEVLCNRFAGTILVPDDAFLAELAGRPATYETARKLADHFKVSALVIFRKFRDHRLITATDYAEAHKRSEAEEDRGSGGNFYNNQMAYLGRAYVGMALRAFRQHRISETQLADYLLVAPKNISGLETRYLKGTA
jgi:Zn-dependent peptidase ImmA (M78 family)